MRIRQAAHEDLRPCLGIDPSFVTDHVWQIKERKHMEETVLTFQTARLPRPIRVAYPRALRDLEMDLESRECFLVLEQEGEDGEKAAIRGYLDLVTVNQGQTGWIKHLVVDEPFRGRGLGARLVGAAVEWCDYQRLHWIMAECQTKNYAAIRLYQKSGLSFCGYNDMYYVSKDIALFFGKDLSK